MSKTERAAHKDRLTKIHADVTAVVRTGKCPSCGAGLRRNISITGWWQCAQVGAEGFRADSTKPSCSWQGFTE